MVAEADESDRSFLKLFPTIAVITNIDHEHLESYGGFDDLQQAFVDFANKVPFYGAVVACADDPHLAAVLPRMTRRVDHLRPRRRRTPTSTATDVVLGPLAVAARSSARARAGPATGAPATLGPLTLHVPGRHNLLNALAAVAVGLELGLPFERIAAGLREFRGAERRFERARRAERHPRRRRLRPPSDRDRRGARGGARARAAASSSRFSRTATRARAALMDAFGPALAGADHVVLTDIYAAGEDPIPGVDARGAGRGRPPRRSRRRSTSCRGSTTWSPALARDRAARRRRDHARRRLDRHRARSAASRALRGGRGMSPVAAPADKRFRRAHVKPARKRGRLARSRLGRWSSARRRRARRRCARLPRRRRASRTPACCRSIASSCAATSGCRAAKCSRVLDGLRGAEHAVDRSRRLARAAAASPWVRDAALRRVAAVDGRSRRVASGSRSASAASTARLYLVDERGVVIDEYGPQYADLDLPIIDGLARRPPGDAAPIDEPRASWRRGCSRRSQRSRSWRSGCRRSTSATRTTRS